MAPTTMAREELILLKFEGQCKACKKNYSCEKPSTRIEIEGYSNIEISFCDKCTEKFKEWMKEKDYLKTDCWCKHIAEFIGAKSETII